MPSSSGEKWDCKKRSLWFWVYQVGLAAFGAVYLAARALRGRPLAGLRERLAVYSDAQKRGIDSLDGPLWIHLVSVGEVMAARPFLEEMRRRFPQRAWLITTTTSTGRSVAQRLVREGTDQLLYLPWDLTPVVRRVVRSVRPRLFLSFETELWPALFRELAAAQVPVAVVNGRVSPSAYRRYLWVRPLMERALLPVSVFFTQGPQDARRFAGIGAAKDRIAVTGNMKWDQEMPADGAQPDGLRGELGVSAGQLLWTAGSTHEGEEALLLRAYAGLRAEFPGLRLLIAPRHPERVPAVEQQVRAAGLEPVRRSAIPDSAPGAVPGRMPAAGLDPVILLDSVGELAGVYASSDVVFVGGSLVPHGGHNLVEPAALARPILTGPHLHNFQAVSEALAQAGGALVVKSEQQLREALRRLLRDPAVRAEMGRRAQAVFRENRGAAARTADLITLRWGRQL